MKLRINKVCDLSSISVLPPRRSGGMMSSGTEGLGKSHQPSQIRSQSQQSFSQGSFSQLSQSSLDDNLMNDQRLCPQEKDNSSKRISSSAPITSAQDEYQLQLSKPSNNILRRWNASTVSDNRCRLNEELALKIRLMESSLNKIGMLLDSVQGDILHVNKSVKEVALEADGIRQKINLFENSLQQMVTWGDNVKTSLDGILRSITEQLISNSSISEINDIATTLRSLQHHIEARFTKFEHELLAAFTKQKEVLRSISKSPDSEHIVLLPLKRSHTDGKLYMKGQKPGIKPYVAPSMGGNNKSIASVMLEDGKLSTIKPKLSPLFNREVLLRGKQEKNCRIILDSDEDSDEDPSCLVVKQEREKKVHSAEEMHQEAMLILKKARKRRRRMNQKNVDRRTNFICC